jgi:hypothetical protein
MEDADDNDDGCGRWSATMMETNDNPPNNVRVALTSTVVAVVANSG